MQTEYRDQNSVDVKRNTDSGVADHRNRRNFFVPTDLCQAPWVQRVLRCTGAGYQSALTFLQNLAPRVVPGTKDRSPAYA